MPEISTSGWVKFILGILVVIFVLVVLAPIIKFLVDVIIGVAIGLAILGGGYLLLRKLNG